MFSNYKYTGICNAFKESIYLQIRYWQNSRVECEETDEVYDLTLEEIGNDIAEGSLEILGIFTSTAALFF